MKGREVTRKMKKLLVFFLAFAVVVAISLASFAQDQVEGKVEALNKAAMKITINGTEYLLSQKAAQVEVKIGDLVQATVKGNIVTTLVVLR